MFICVWVEGLSCYMIWSLFFIILFLLFYFFYPLPLPLIFPFYFCPCRVQTYLFGSLYFKLFYYFFFWGLDLDACLLAPRPLCILKVVWDLKRRNDWILYPTEDPNLFHFIILLLIFYFVFLELWSYTWVLVLFLFIIFSNLPSTWCPVPVSL